MSNSVLDEQGDVGLYNAPDGERWIFRDNVCHGLRMGGAGGITTLYKEGQGVPAVRIRAEGRDWVARWEQSKAVAFRHDTRYGLIAKVARRLLQPAACCRREQL
ncbi:hypothetical protein Ade02nite_20880 [Paractinoplanes deccanensis]|uniref:Uncharacterized protein n=1 Tax=Paractinoplanes deccanensis TaxID=113561 RepID=A0ABQ3Y0G3_9ACTN|nr:hypothetical protein [Actinoplanes deccanensis]GID73447.1 hypothetical protein Ade02nite_20880 [Actinoplanes deccanensis]